MHVCCAPCFIAPYQHLREEGEYDVTGFWFNDNIHPYKEYRRRLDTFLEWSERENVSCILDDVYQPEHFFRRIANREEERCFFCYYIRMQKTAERAKRESFSAFTTTLLYSVYQKHEMIKRIGKELADMTGVPFYYHDFREYWREGIDLSKKAEMYRQPYCGCLYSERDRYHKRK